MGALRSILFRVVVMRERAMRVRVLLASLVASSIVSLACSDGALVTDPVQPDTPAFTIADGGRGFKEGFYWLPPMVADPVTSGTFDGALSPVVEICALDGDACDPGQDLVGTFTTEGSESTRVRVDPEDEHYIVNWHLDEYDLTASTTYRISVFAGQGVLLGYADVEPVTNGSELRNVDTGAYIGLVDDRTLPIKFRIESGFAARLDIEPGGAAITVGQTQQFTGTVTDLHGNILSASVAWTSGDETVASVDGSGLATGVGPGSTTITGTFDHLSASAVLAVEPEVGETGWAQVSAGDQHSCAVTSNGDAYCWGRGASGQLGNGATDNLLAPGAVAGDHAFASITAGAVHTCGLTLDGAAFCWGTGAGGQLGNGTTDDELLPTPVAGNHRFASINAGFFHTCGVTADGDGFCWGHGGAGKLGNGGTDDQLSPTAVTGSLAFAAIDAGGTHTCGVTTAGDAFCWGEAFFGALGDGSGSGFEASPVAVLGNHQFASVSAGNNHTCGVTVDGDGLCWGSGARGRVGYGGSGIVSTPVSVLGGHAFSSVSAGGSHTCGVTTDGDAFCWGIGGLGELGYGGTDDQLSPVAVTGGLQFASVRAGDNFHTCGVTNAGGAYCWGLGTLGQLGNGQTVNQFVPAQVLDPF